MNEAADCNSNPEMFRPPVNRLMRVLDRPFFQKEIRLCAAQIINPKDISKTRAELKSDLLSTLRLKSIVSIPGQDHQTKALLLRPEIRKQGTNCGSREHVKKKKIVSEHNAYSSMFQMTSLGVRRFENSIVPKKSKLSIMT